MSRIKKGDIVTLLPKSKRLKQIRREHGTKFRVVQGPLKMQCFGNNVGIQIESVSPSKHFRNVLLEDVEVIE